MGPRATLPGERGSRRNDWDAHSFSNSRKDDQVYIPIEQDARLRIPSFGATERGENKRIVTLTSWQLIEDQPEYSNMMVWFYQGRLSSQLG
jgi:hypothetical protein